MQADDSKLLIIVTADEHVYLGKDEITGALEDRLANKRASEGGKGGLHPSRREREVRGGAAGDGGSEGGRGRKAWSDHGSAGG